MPEKVLGGRYQVQDRIGTGGMATVFRGLDEVLGRTVAIKTMLPQYATDPSFAARFKQEAQAAAALQSPYIVSVYDWGKDGDTYYIIMEYLRGTDLKSGIRKHGALDCKKVAQIGSQIAQALSVAHKHDIIHRDIKPQNIMVQPDGNIKVMDFGIARAKNSHLTTDNSVLGTAHYVSPEQTQGKELGPTTDIYSLGIVMYEASTGRVPFEGDDAISVALKQVNEQPVPPSQLNPAIDPQIESIILKCMQKNPADRFQTADELYRVLRDYLAGRVQAVNSATAMLPVQTTNVIEDPRRGIGGTATIPRVNQQHYRTKSATDEAEENEKKGKGKRRTGLVIGIIAAIAAVAALAYFVIVVLGQGTATYAVPNYLGLTEDEAVAQINATGSHFKLDEVTYQYSDSVDEGIVMDQSPNANRQVTEGTTVTLVVSKGKEPAATVTVPDLQNMTPSEAVAALTKVGLNGQAGDSVYSTDVDNGKVAEQSPAANSTAKAGDTVTYSLSKGPEMVTVPSDLTGNSQSYVTGQLTDAGLTYTVSKQSSSTYDEGIVISVSPSSGSSVEKGSSVTVTVSTGPATEKVPSVIGSTESSARSQLSDFTVKVQYQSSSSYASGTVIDQSPSGGTSATYGSTVVLTVSSGSAEKTDSSTSSSKTSG